jgi:hypothetical protein
MAKHEAKRPQRAEDRAARGQSLARGDTGTGGTGVAPDRQGISNRPGDRDDGAAADERDGERSDREVAERTRPRAPDRETREARDQMPPTTGLGVSASGRGREEGPDRIERSGAQQPAHRDPEALASSDIEPSERETM